MRWVGGRLSEGMGLAAMCKANDRADNGLVLTRSKRHEANHDTESIIEEKPILSLAKY